MVALLAVMPTVGRRPRRIRSGNIDSIWLSPAPKQLICRRRMTRRPPPTRPAIVAATESCHISTISAGTPGRQITRQGRTALAGHFQVDARRRAVRIPHHAAAGGKHRLQFVLRRHRPAPPGEHRPDVLQRLGVESATAGRSPAANASRVRSSAVGPSPPVATTTSARSIARRNTSAHGSNSSPTVRVEEHADAQFLQPLAEPLGVGVESLTAGDFVTDGEDFGVHQAIVAPAGSSAPESRRFGRERRRWRG